VLPRNTKRREEPLKEGPYSCSAQDWTDGSREGKALAAIARPFFGIYRFITNSPAETPPTHRTTPDAGETSLGTTPIMADHETTKIDKANHLLLVSP
jgi:hypothetical protein